MGRAVFAGWSSEVLREQPCSFGKMGVVADGLLQIILIIL